MRIGVGVVVICGFGVAAAAAMAERPGVSAPGPWNCPVSHPIKGYASAESGQRVYFLPTHPFYDEASPERCYASEDEARDDGRQPASVPISPGIFSPFASFRGGE